MVRGRSHQKQQMHQQRKSPFLSRRRHLFLLPLGLSVVSLLAIQLRSSYSTTSVVVQVLHDTTSTLVVVGNGSHVNADSNAQQQQENSNDNKDDGPSHDLLIQNQTQTKDANTTTTTTLTTGKRTKVETKTKAKASESKAASESKSKALHDQRQDEQARPIQDLYSDEEEDEEENGQETNEKQPQEEEKESRTRAVTKVDSDHAKAAAEFIKEAQAIEDSYEDEQEEDNEDQEREHQNDSQAQEQQQQEQQEHDKEATQEITTERKATVVDETMKDDDNNDDEAHPIEDSYEQEDEATAREDDDRNDHDTENQVASEKLKATTKAKLTKSKTTSEDQSEKNKPETTHQDSSSSNGTNTKAQTQRSKENKANENKPLLAELSSQNKQTEGNTQCRVDHCLSLGPTAQEQYPNKIVFQFKYAAGLMDRVVRLKNLMELGAMLCATVEVPPPSHLLQSKHNAKAEVSTDLKWDDFASYKFLKDQTIQSASNEGPIEDLYEDEDETSPYTPLPTYPRQLFSPLVHSKGVKMGKKGTSYVEPYVHSRVSRGNKKKNREIVHTFYNDQNGTDYVQAMYNIVQRNLERQRIMQQKRTSKRTAKIPPHESFVWNIYPDNLNDFLWLNVQDQLKQMLAREQDDHPKQASVLLSHYGASPTEVLQQVQELKNAAKEQVPMTRRLSRGGMPVAYAEMKSSSHYKNGGFEEDHPGVKCVHVPQEGWGNVLLRVLADLMAYARPIASSGPSRFKYPCVLGYGGLVGDLLSNVQHCPRHWTYDTCQERAPKHAINPVPRMNMTASHRKLSTTNPDDKDRKPTMDEIRLYLKKQSRHHKELFQLNWTFAESILERTNTRFSVGDLQNQQACAVHIRFGDFHSRQESEMSDDDLKRRAKRLLFEKAKDKFGRACSHSNVQKCFDPLVREIQTQHCPNPKAPTFIATDVDQFLPYFCLKMHHANRTVWSSCKPPQQRVTNHIKDVTLVQPNKPFELQPHGLQTVLNLVRDWLVLALSPKNFAIAHSSFSETATTLGFYAQKPSHDAVVPVLADSNRDKKYTFEYSGVHVTLGQMDSESRRHQEEERRRSMSVQQDGLFRTSSVVPMLTQGNLQGIGCGSYIKNEYPAKLVELAQMVLQEALEADRSTDSNKNAPLSLAESPPFGYLHIRRGDTKTMCNTTLERMSEFLDCSFSGLHANGFLNRYHDQGKGGKFVMFYATDEQDDHYRQSIARYLESQPFRLSNNNNNNNNNNNLKKNHGHHQNLVRAVDLDQSVQNVVQREVQRGSIPQHYLSNYIIFWIGKILGRASLFSLSQRKVRQCPSCSQGLVDEALERYRSNSVTAEEWWDWLLRDQQERWNTLEFLDE